MIAAQIGTAPLVIFYFARFSTHFLLTNLCIPINHPIITHTFRAFANPHKKSLQIQNSILQQIELWPYASFDHLYLDAYEVFLIYLILLTVFWKNALLSTLLIFSIYHTTILDTENIPNCPSVHCLSNGPQSWLVCSDSIPRPNWLCQSLASYWNSMGLSAPIILTQRYETPPILLENNILTYKGKRICLLNHNRWNTRTAEHPLPIDILYISHGYRGSINELTSLFHIQTVILDGSLSNYSKNHNN